MSSSHSSRKKSSISEVLTAKQSNLEHSSYRNISFPNKSSKKIKSALKSQNGIESFSKNCRNPYFFTTFFSATVDETVIEGILTLLDYLSSFTCGHEFIKEPSLVKVPPKVPSPIFSEKIKTVESLPVEPVPVASVPKVTVFMVSELLSAIGIEPEVASAIAQTSFIELHEEKPELVNKVLQTSTPEMVSEILQTIGFTPEQASKILQTSFVSLVESKPSMASHWLQTSSPEFKTILLQTTPPASLVSMFMQTSEIAVPQEEPKLEIEPKPDLEVEPEPEPEPKKSAEVEQEIFKNESSEKPVSEVVLPSLPEPIKEEKTEETQTCNCCKCCRKRRYRQYRPFCTSGGRLLALAEGDSYSLLDIDCICSGTTY